APAEEDLAGFDAPGRAGNEAKNRQRRHGLAGAGLTDDAEDLVLAHVERDAVDGLGGQALDVEVGLEPADFEERRARGRVGHRNLEKTFGSKASRTASPIMTRAI